MGPKRIPFITTADGRTIRFPSPNIKEHDSIKINIESGEIIDYYKYKIGAPVLIVGGNNIGRVGLVFVIHIPLQVLPAENTLFYAQNSNFVFTKKKLFVQHSYRDDNNCKTRYSCRRKGERR